MRAHLMTRGQKLRIFVASVAAAALLVGASSSAGALPDPHRVRVGPCEASVYAWGVNNGFGPPMRWQFAWACGDGTAGTNSGGSW